jgi:hypothetical protein
MIVTIFFFVTFVVVIGMWLLYERSKPYRYKYKLIEVEELLEKSNNREVVFNEIMALRRLASKEEHFEVSRLIERWIFKFRTNE